MSDAQISPPDDQPVDDQPADTQSSLSGLSAESRETLQALVARSQNVMAHAWMIRTFIKHCDEVEDFPELNEMARTIFDVFRAVETQVHDPVSYFRTVRKKLSRLQAAAVQFQKDAWHASTHTNFQQCAIAAQFLGQQLAELVSEAERLIPRPAPPKFTPPRSGG